MTLEPQVEKSIKRNHKAVLFHRFLVVVPLAVVFLAEVIITILISLKTSGQPSLLGDPDIGGIIFMQVVIVAVLFPLLYAGVPFFRLILPARRQFKSLMVRAVQFDSRGRMRFRRALDAVSIGVGIDPPDLVVLDLPTANTISFYEKSIPKVGLTPELLQAELSAHEVESLMSHEACHIAAGDALRSPGSLMGIAWPLIGLVVLLTPIYILMGRMGLGSSTFTILTVFFMVLNFLVVPLTMYLIMRPYSISRLNPTLFHSDILADSVAAKVINNPKAVRDALEKMVAMMKASDRMPGQTIAFTQLYIGPLREWYLRAGHRVPGIFEAIQKEESYDVLSIRLGEWLGLPYRNRDGRDAPRVTKDASRFNRWENKLIDARLENIKKIENNIWEAFQVRGGRPIVPPDKWFR